MKSILSVAALSLILAAPAMAQDSAMKVCGEKWQAAKASGAAAGKTWPKFLAECRAGLTPAPATEAGKASAAAAPARPAAKRAATGGLVFPAAISDKYASLTPAQARRKTCADQYKANKTAEANGGLSWIEKGGGYWSQCNRKLKS